MLRSTEKKKGAPGPPVLTSERIDDRQASAPYYLLASVLGPSCVVVGLLVSLVLLGPMMDRLFGPIQRSSPDVIENAEVYRALGAELVGVSLLLGTLNFLFGFFANRHSWRWGLWTSNPLIVFISIWYFNNGFLPIMLGSYQLGTYLALPIYAVSLAIGVLAASVGGRISRQRDGRVARA
jgi:hypothetical protein